MMTDKASTLGELKEEYTLGTNKIDLITDQAAIDQIVRLQATIAELLEALKQLLGSYEWLLLRLAPRICECGRSDEIAISIHDWSCPYRALFRDNSRPFTRAATIKAIHKAEEQA